MEQKDPLPAYRRHNISDKLWELLEPHLPGRKGTRGGKAKDNRLFLNAIFWIFRTGAPWRDLPPYYGDGKNTHRRFCRWRNKGVWEKLFNLIAKEPEVEWLVMDSSYIKAHPDSSGAKGGNQQMNRSKGGLTTKLHLAVDGEGIPIKLLLSEGIVSDYKKADYLMSDIKSKGLLADGGYDSDKMVNEGLSRGMKVVIPPRRSRKSKRGYDKVAYKLGHVVENAFFHIKRWGGIGTRYAKNDFILYKF